MLAFLGVTVISFSSLQIWRGFDSYFPEILVIVVDISYFFA